MKHIYLLLLTLFTLAFTTGCSVTPKYRVTIDAITAPDVSTAPSSYEIKSLNDRKSTDGLLFQKYSLKLAQILEEKGYQKVNTGQAEQYIYFDYGIDKVNESIETYSEPDISFHMGLGHPFGGYYGGYSPFFYDSYYGGGYTTYQERHIYYNRYITLLAKDKSNKELWRVDVASIGESKNLRKIIPILIEAAAPYLGTNTAEPVKVIIKDSPKKK